MYIHQQYPDRVIDSTLDGYLNIHSWQNSTFSFSWQLYTNKDISLFFLLVLYDYHDYGESIVDNMLNKAIADYCK